MAQEFQKFLLAAVNAKYIHSNPAIYSLRAYAGEQYAEVIELAEYTINQQMQDILADLYHRNPSAIGFSCYIWNWNMVRYLLHEIPKVLPNTDIWLGGPEVSYHCEKLLVEYPQVKGVMIGEGEVTFTEILACYVSGKQDFSKVPGLCLRDGYTAMRDLTDMDKIPFLYTKLESFENRIIYYETSRGCPYRCCYCLSSIDKKVRLRSMDIVQQELQFFLDHKVKQVKFVDRTFNCNHEHAMGIWQYLIEHDNGVTNFHFEISADILRESEIEMLAKARPGLFQLEIGVQSTNPQTIKAIDRVMNVEKLEKIVSSIHAGKNIHQHLDLIAGLPYEDYESFGKSFDRVYAMEPQQLQMGFLKVLKGSPMEERAEEYGITYLDFPPYEVLSSKWLPYKDVLRLKQIEEMVELYYNSNQFTHTLPILVQAFSGPFAMYEALAAFYERKQYFVNSPARSYRYQVLLDFAMEVDGERAKLYKELLTYDMYLRENLKSRPDFAGELTAEYKDYARSFFQSAEARADYFASYEQYDWKQVSKMMHLELFQYPVWDPKACQEKKSGGYVLFDYQNRNPLTYEARATVISKEP